MREITVKLYQFDELSDKAKEVARAWYREMPFDQDVAWENTVDDAQQISLKITCLSAREPNQGEFINGPMETLEKILSDHGDTCETYKTAKQYERKLRDPEDTENMEETVDDFLNSLLEDYRIMLDKEVEYRYSDEAVDESIEANEYEFTADGKRARV